MCAACMCVRTYAARNYLTVFARGIPSVECSKLSHGIEVNGQKQFTPNPLFFWGGGPEENHQITPAALGGAAQHDWTLDLDDCTYNI